MKEISTEIEYKGKKYKLLFNLNVMEEIQEKYGSVKEWGELAEPTEGESNVKALKFGFMTMLNEGIDIANEENGTNIEPLTLKQVGRMISNLGMAEAQKALSNTVVESAKNNEKNE